MIRRIMILNNNICSSVPVVILAKYFSKYDNHFIMETPAVKKIIKNCPIYCSSKTFSQGDDTELVVLLTWEQLLIRKCRAKH